MDSEKDTYSDNVIDSKVDVLSSELRTATLDKCKKFENIRGKTCEHPFWDVVVLSALDDAQKKAYETQLADKQLRKELPLSPAYHVVHDPVGVKVGNGGGVIAVLDELEKIYSEKLKTLKVLILLSGGYSQRLPSASLLGKIFTALPMGDPIYQMLEFKLAMYIDFPTRMKPGVFVSSADCIELYELQGDGWNFNNPGFTSLAHPSPIEIGTTHGVHVLENLEEFAKNFKTDSASVGKCRRFIHKPSKEFMRASGAVFLTNGEEYVFSDSAYFMDMDAAHLLLEWYRKRNGLNCEIDAYGDFLQALGPEATKEYCKNVQNVTQVLPELIKTREEIFDILQNTEHHVLMLNKSKFYHIGTTKEYIENFCMDKCFRNEMGCSNHAMVKCPKSLESLKPNNVIFHSSIKNLVGLTENVVIEYTSLNFANDIGMESIISNNIFPSGVRVPAKSFLHTVVIRDEDYPLYVTVAFGVEDNLKKCCNSRSDTKSLKYAGLPFNEALDKLNLLQDPWSEDCVLLNLWHAKLFPAFYDPEDAVQNGAKMLEACRTSKRYKITSKKAVYSCNYSMADVLRLKDLEKILEMRSELRKEIES